MRRELQDRDFCGRPFHFASPYLLVLRLWLSPQRQFDSCSRVGCRSEDVHGSEHAAPGQQTRVAHPQDGTGIVLRLDLLALQSSNGGFRGLVGSLSNAPAPGADNAPATSAADRYRFRALCVHFRSPWFSSVRLCFPSALMVGMANLAPVEGLARQIQELPHKAL